MPESPCGNLRHAPTSGARPTPRGTPNTGPGAHPTTAGGRAQARGQIHKPHERLCVPARPRGVGETGATASSRGGGSSAAGAGVQPQQRQHSRAATQRTDDRPHANSLRPAQADVTS